MSHEYPACNLCGAHNARLLYPATAIAGSDVPSAEFACTSPYLAQYDDIVRCEQCGLIYSVGGLPTDAIMDNYEEVEDPTYLVEEERRREAFGQSLDLIDWRLGEPTACDQPSNRLGSSKGAACRQHSREKSQNRDRPGEGDQNPSSSRCHTRRISPARLWTRQP